MKIWYQSSCQYRYDPYWDNYGKSLEAQCKAVARPGTEVYVAGTRFEMTEIEFFRYIHHFHSLQLLNNYLKAEKEGYDAVLIGCTFDTALAEAREMLSIPVVGMFQTGCHMAAMLGRKFAVVTSSEPFAEHFSEMVDSYGLQGRFQGAYVWQATVPEMHSLVSNPGSIIGKIKAAAKRAIADGASVIIPVSGLTMVLAHDSGLTKTGIDGVPVLDMVGIGVKTAEALVDLKEVGVTASRKLQVYGSPSREFLKKSLDAYAKVTKIESPW